ncbi:MAG: class I SAM-dependent methyltransferase, partial [Selenomonadaceae bacterium]|nr:class I SAM-dependent methyltransferase [Selenomonadaceae bacterium]
MYMETLSDDWQRRNPGNPEEGTGGKAMDYSQGLILSDWQRAISHYFGQLKKTSKNKAQEGADYFATPEPIGFKMVEWLGLRDGERVLEPSAGHGAISRWFSPNTRNTIVEASGKLSPLAQLVTPDAKVITGTFENFDLVNKFEGIAMNPPFGVGGKTAMDHVAKAYKHLAEGGRLIAIVPEGSSMEKRFEKWFNGKDAEDAILTATIHLPSVTFEQAGTSVATKILVIDKHNDKKNFELAEENAGYELDLRNVKDINELFAQMENLKVPERIINEEKENPFAEIENNFEIGTHTHTKTGAKMPSAKLKDRVERDEYLKLNALAKKNGGDYSTFAKAFLFNTEQGRNNFVADANQQFFGAKKTSENVMPNQQEESTQQVEEKNNSKPVYHEFQITEKDAQNTAEDWDTIKITVKKSKNGANLYYDITGKKITESAARWIDVKDKPEKVSRLLNNFKDSSNSTNDFNDSINKYQVYVYYRLGGSPETQSKPFRTLENAVACARYIYNNRGNVRIDEVWVCPKGSSGEKIFKINKDGTVSYRDDVSVIVKNEFEKPVQQFDSNQVTDDKIKIPPIKSRYDWKNTSILYEDYYSDADSEITTPEGKIKMHFRIADSTANEGGIAIVNMEELGKSNSSLRSALYPEAKKRGGQRAGEQLGYRPNDHAYYFGNGKNAYEYVEKILDEYYPETAISENATEINLEDIAEKVHDNHNARKVRMFSFSHTGNGSTAIINLVDDRNLTEPHKLLQQFGESIGVNVQFFNNYNKNFHGAYENGTVYLNVNSARSLTSTFAHEIFHFLKESNPKLFEEIAKAAGITQEQLTNYLAETKREDVKETADITEEMIADAMQEILNRVARKDKSLVERFFAWLKDTLQKFKDIFNNPKGKLTRAQYARMADTFGKMAVKLKDADGNKIFRYNTRTHNLELANGESLDGLLEDTENEIYSSEEQGFFNWDSLSLAGAKLSVTGNIDNTDKKVDNTRNSDNKINDYLTITADGDFDVKLLNERPAVGKETERERIERRKKEIANMDKLLDVKVNPDAYAQLLSDRTIDTLEKYAKQLGSWDKAEKSLRLKYNSFLANYSKSNPEKKVISYLLNLKGAIRYAGQRKS